MRWFRFYNDAMRHPKVAQLSDAHFRLWLELLCVASENDGRIPSEHTLKTVLRRRLDHLQGALSAMLKAGLMDRLEDGYTPHGWDKRQYKSDSSTERSRLHRQKCNVAATVDATAPETEPDTETEDLEPKGSCASSDALQPAHIVEMWNEIAPNLGKPVVRTLTPERRQLLKARIGQYTIDDFVAVFGKIQASAFLRGDRDWRGCTFDWVFKKANFQKILEGNYDD